MPSDPYDRSNQVKHFLPVVALLMATAGGLTDTVAAPPQVNKNVQTSAFGNMQIGNLYSQFSVQVFQLVDGTVHGDIQISRSDFSSGASDYLICAAEKWHSVISMPAGSGNVSINAVLDPADPTCSGTYVGPALTVGLYGQPNLTNGGERRSEKGSGQAWTDGASYKYNFQLDAFSESFTGTNGFASGTFEGTAQISRAYDRQRVDP